MCNLKSEIKNLKQLSNQLVSNLQRNDSTINQPEGNYEHENQRDSKTNSKQNSGPNSRPMSRTSSQQRFNTQSNLDNSNGGGTHNTTTIEESVIDETAQVREPVFSQYEQQPQLQQVEQPGISIYDQPEQQYQESTTNEYDQGYGQQQNYDGTNNQPQYTTGNEYEQQPSEQDLGSTYDNTTLNYEQSQEQYISDSGQQQPQYDPSFYSQQDTEQGQPSEQTPESTSYQPEQSTDETNDQQNYPDQGSSERQSPDQENNQQQSESPSPSTQSQSATPSPVQKSSAPSPNRAPKAVRGTKPEKAGEQKPGRGAVGEASGRKSQQGDLPKQPAKALSRSSIVPKK